MCRLFGLHADKRVVTATFWLLAAPDNLAEQSKSNPDGTGLGVFEADGKPVLESNRWPLGRTASSRPKHAS